MLYADTIAAIATPPGEGGIGIVRISGPAAPTILQRVFTPIRPGVWRAYRMRFGHVVDAQGHTIDEALAVLMRAPRSFTAEDVAEISCHGGPLVVSQVLALALAYGARQAEPGEFTMRAFVNGRLDLAQAEATLDVIRAKTATGLALAQAQLGGWLSQALRQVRETLLAPLAYFTALVDFPEDEVDTQDVTTPLRAGLHELEQLLTSADQGIVYRQGARAVLVGRPNAGKSSLLNALLRADRAIVTPIPGTTRDTLEETANLQGIPVVLIDTAGITETSDPIEQLGVARSQHALAAANLVLWVRDISTPTTDADREIATLIAEKPTITVWNKCDLVETAVRQQRTAQTFSNTNVAVSAHTGIGLDELVQAVVTLLLGGAVLNSDSLVSNPRHRDAIARAANHVRDAITGYTRGVPSDLLAVDLTAALSAIGEVTGEAIDDDLLAAIFSRFCIGK